MTVSIEIVKDSKKIAHEIADFVVDTKENTGWSGDGNFLTIRERVFKQLNYTLCRKYLELISSPPLYQHNIGDDDAIDDYMANFIRENFKL